MTGNVRPAVLVLLAGAGLVLLIACANISGLQLARQIGRRRDLAIQSALGATRARQVRQQLAEAMILAVPAGYAGLILGIWVLAAIGSAAPALSGFGLTTSPGMVVIAYTFLLSIVAGTGVRGDLHVDRRHTSRSSCMACSRSGPSIGRAGRGC